MVLKKRNRQRGFENEASNGFLNLGYNWTHKCSIIYLLCGLISVILFLYTLLSMFLPPTDMHHEYEGDVKTRHEPSTFTDDWLVTVASQTDVIHFNHTYLAPFMRQRVSGSEGSKAVQEHIKRTVRSLGYTVEEDTFSANVPPLPGIKNPVTFNNIIATMFPGGQRTLTLACHHDSKYFAPDPRYPRGFIGATDSAVPCAQLLEIARVIKKLEDEHKAQYKQKHLHHVTLQLLFLDGEEAFQRWTATDSLYGARHLAAKWDSEKKTVGREMKMKRIETIDYFVLLDLIGAESVPFTSWFSHSWKLFERLITIENRLAKSNQLTHKTGGRYFTGATRYENGGIQDDHIPFLQRNVKILHLIPYPFPKVWHEMTDDWAALDFARIKDLNKIFAVFVGEYLNLLPS